jgi:hypothetical protein
MWEPQRLTTLWASTACYRDSFTYNKHKSSLPSQTSKSDSLPDHIYCEIRGNAMCHNTEPVSWAWEANCYLIKQAEQCSPPLLCMNKSLVGAKYYDRTL